MIFLNQSKTIILASNSTIRKKILEDVGIEFKTISPLFDEEAGKEQNKHLSIKNLAKFLAEQKALSVSSLHRDKLIIGADQICEIDGNIIDKSKNLDDAFLQLKKLNGKIHYQNNATVVALNGKIIFSKFVKVKLKLRKISEKEIAAYVNIDKPCGSAGSYKYENLGKHLFEKINGDYYSVLGLNLQSLLNFLHRKKFIIIKT